jgi:hypothetical protein
VPDFLFVARNSISNADLTVVDGSGAVVDADGLAVSAQLITYATSASVLSRPATRVALGVYRITLSSIETGTPGLYVLTYVYTLGGIPQTYSVDIEVATSTSPLYESLSDGLKHVVESVWNRFSDLFDSAIGGPHLQMYAQSNFGRERVAELMQIGVERLNSIAQPHQSYSLFGATEFPYSQWGGLLASATYIEVIKHLMRSYVEQPDAVNITSSRLDRREYLNRWNIILQNEQGDLKSQLDVFKLAAMNLGQASILVAGGIYGNYTRNTPVTRPQHRPPWNY